MARHFGVLQHTQRVYFAGGHDGGYATLLRSLQTDGVLDKFVMLRSNIPFARAIDELGPLELDVQDIFFRFNGASSSYLEQQPDADVFLSSPPPPSYGLLHDLAPSIMPASPALELASRRNLKTPDPSPLPPVQVPSSSPEKNRRSRRRIGAKYDMYNVEPPPKEYLPIRSELSLMNQVPPLCRGFYLHTLGCRLEPCRFSHDYRLTPETLAEFRAQPCRHVHKGKSKSK